MLIKRFIMVLPLLMLLVACQLGGDQPTPDTEPVEATTVPPAGGGTADSGEPVAEGEPAVEADPTVTEPPAATATPTEVPDPLADLDPSGVSLRFWHPYDDEREMLIQGLVEEFNGSNEQGITVSAETVASDGSELDRLLEGVQEGEVQLLAAGSGNLLLPTIHERLIDLVPYLSSGTWGMAGGEGMPGSESSDPLLSLPHFRAVNLLLYNVELLNELDLEAPPTSWDELAEMACTAFDAGHLGYALAYTLDGEEPSHFASLVNSQAASLGGESGQRLTLNSSEAAEVLSLLQDLYESGCMTPVVEQPVTQATFGTGALLFTTDSSSQLSFYQGAVDAGYGGEWAIAPFPHQPDAATATLSTTEVAILESSPEQQLAAWLFAQWLAEPAQQARWLQESGSLPLSPAMAGTVEIPFYSDAVALLDNAQPEPAVPGFPVLQPLIDDAMAQIIEGADVEETLTDINDEVELVAEGFGE